VTHSEPTFSLTSQTLPAPGTALGSFAATLNLGGWCPPSGTPSPPGLQRIDVLSHDALVVGGKATYDALVRAHGPIFDAPGGPSLPAYDPTDGPLVLGSLISKFMPLEPSHTRGTNFVLAYHGCPAHVVHDICRAGFINFRRTDLGWYGSGIYTTDSFSYARSYSTPDATTGLYPVFLCCVIIGTAHPVTTPTDDGTLLCTLHGGATHMQHSRFEATRRGEDLWSDPFVDTHVVPVGMTGLLWKHACASRFEVVSHSPLHVVPLAILWS